jgi:hypothetical protein
MEAAFVGGLFHFSRSLSVGEHGFASSARSFAKPAMVAGRAQFRSLKRMMSDLPTTPKEKARIIAGAISSLVIIGWMVALAISILAAR